MRNRACKLGILCGNGSQATRARGIETPFYELGWGGIMTEDTVVVADHGIERLSVSPSDLVVLG